MTLIVNAEDLAGMIPAEDAVGAVEAAYRSLVEAPQMGSVHTRLFNDGRRATFHPGGSPAHAAAGLFAHFERINFGGAAQSYNAIGRRFYAMYDSDTAELAAIILGSLPLFPFDEPSAFGTETAITSAVGTNVMARRDAKVLALIGTGRQARRHLYLTCRQFPIGEARIFSRNADNVRAFIAEMSGWVDVALTAAGSAEAAVEGADIVMCATASNVPVLDGGRLAAGSHVTSIVNGNKIAARPGEPARYRRELDDETLRRADAIVAVMRAQAVKDDQGDLAEPVANGIIAWDDIVDLGDVLSGRAKGRTGAGQITVFKQNSDQGVGFMALARLGYERARAAGIGVEM
ncbi:MAG: hypothetical protein RLZ98_3362 [Pseudomonadota bacterium]|jgi:ornithine cyclodeaminase/alanine dehydrogenase-like protein (mu-crystallin family)